MLIDGMPAILIGLHALFKFPRRKKVSQGLAGWNPLHRLIGGNAMAHDLGFAGKKPPGGTHLPLAGIVPVNLQRRLGRRHSGHPLIQNFVDVRVLQKILLMGVGQETKWFHLLHHPVFSLIPDILHPVTDSAVFLTGVGIRDDLGAINSRYQQEWGTKIDKFDYVTMAPQYAAGHINQDLLKLFCDESGT